MKKILTLLSHGLLASSFSSNAVLYSSISDQLNLKQNHKLDLKNHIDVYNALESWHNGLTLEQDAKAKQEYEDAMNITTIKGANQGFDKYNITFNNDKLKDMQKDGLINQDVYDIWSNPENAMILTYRSNQLIKNKSSKEGNGLTHLFAFDFFIENNKMHFIDNKTLKSPKILNDINNSSSNQNNFRVGEWIPSSVVNITNVIDETWWKYNFNYAVYEKWIDTVHEARFNPEGIEILSSSFSRLVKSAEESGTFIADQEFIDYLAIIIDLIDSNKKVKIFQKLIMDDNTDMYKTMKTVDNSPGVECIMGVDIDPITSDKTYWSDIVKPIPPLGTGVAKWTDRSTKWNNTPVYHIFKFTSNLSYAKYGSLWEYLNSNLTFNLHEKFESRIGWLTQDKNFNYDFDKDQSISVLKKYWNKYSALTSKKWISRDVSMAEIDLEIVDNPLNKTINFNFKSVLQNQNAIQNCYNFMY